MQNAMKDTALITGASSGIGAEFARIHAARGGDLVLVARREDKLLELKAELEKAHNVSVLVIADDLNDEAAPQRIYAKTEEAGIQVDILINNAGFGGRGKFHEREWADDRSIIQVNIIALTALTRLFLPRLIERSRGKILNVSSTAALMPGPLQAVYFAAKSYVSSFSNAVAEEVRGSGVTVTALLPGATATGFSAASGLESTGMFDKAASASGVAKVGYDAMLKGRLDVFAGLPLGQRIATSIMPLLPKRLVLKEMHKMQSE